MRMSMQLIAISVVVASLAACGSPGAGPPDGEDDEDCEVVGDEDGNDLADCSDPACAGAPACLTGCGNRTVEAGEACDDGNATDGDGCDNNCTATACGNGIPSGTEACDDGNATDGDGCDRNCTITGCGNGIATDGEACDDGNATGGDGCENDCTISRSVGGPVYVKASSNVGPRQFGHSVALSADGSTLAVGGIWDRSEATGIDGDQTNNAAVDSGAVYVFARSGASWIQQAYVKASNTGAGDLFGSSVALSADGSTLAVGARLEDSAAIGIDGDQASNAATNSGAVYVFTRSGVVWSQQAYVKASNTGANDNFGHSLALSGDGATLAVGAFGEASNATGIDGDQANNTAANAGAVYVLALSGTAWIQQAYVKASNAGAGDRFGITVALSGDGTTLAVGADSEDSAATGIDGDPVDNTAVNAGAVYVLARSGTTWAPQAYVKASNTGAGDFFGGSVALSADASTLAIGAYNEDSAATGIDGDSADNTAVNAGAVYVIARSGATWAQQAYVKASNTGGGDIFGSATALSSDGSTLAVGTYSEDSAATGLGGDQTNNSASQAGAVYKLTRSGTTWSHGPYVKAFNTGAGDLFGWSLALSSDGALMAVGAPRETSAAIGIDGDQTNNALPFAGAVYLYP